MKRIKVRRLDVEVHGDGLDLRIVAIDAETDGAADGAISELLGSILRTRASAVTAEPCTHTVLQAAEKKT